MKYQFQFLFLFLLIISLSSQEKVLANKQEISTILVNDKKTNVEYHSSVEGFFSPNGPFIDGYGILYFYPTYSRQTLLKFSGNVFSSTGLTNNIDDFDKLISAQYVFVSQQGMITVSGNGQTFTFYNNTFYDEIFDWTDRKVRANDYHTIPILGGMILDSITKKILLSAQFSTDGQILIRDLSETRAWLPTQPGGFSIGDDGLLYRNGMLWSAIKPKSINSGSQYLGRTMSGHCIWSNDNAQFATTLVVAQPSGEIEVTLDVPVQHQWFNYGIGPWGEIYYLFPPVPTYHFKEPNGGAWPEWKSGSAELVVVRNHLKYFGRLNDGGVRLRKEPGTGAEVLGTYPNKTGFRILETGTKSETIGGQTNVWYKVRLLDGKEGWFFGAFVHNLYDGPNVNPPPWPNVPDW